MILNHDGPVYHTTLNRFDALHKGSWLTTSLQEAVVQALVKHETPETRSQVLVLTIPWDRVPEADHVAQLNGCINFTTLHEVQVKPSWFIPLRELRHSLPPSVRALLSSKSLSLLPLIRN